MIVGPGSAIIAVNVIGVYGVAFALRPRTACDGLHNRSRLRMPHQPGRHAGLLADAEDHHGAGRLTGEVSSSEPSSAAWSSSSFLTPRTSIRTGVFAANGWGADIGSNFGLGSTIVVEMIFTALLIFVASTTTKGYPVGFGVSPPV